MHMDTLLLISPSSNTFYTLSAPLGISYLANEITCCDVYGLDLDVYRHIFEMTQEKILETIMKIVELYDVTYVGISILEETMDESFKIANLCSDVGCTVIAGGILPTLYPEDMSEHFDYIVRGDSEKELADLLLCLSTGQSTSHIQGLSFKKDNSWHHQGTPIGPNCKNNIIPEREIFDKFNFGYEYKTARMITSRGCIYNCSFCTNRKIDSKFCRRDIDDIINEVKYLILEKKVEQITFSDDQFLGTTMNEYKAALEIIDAIKDLLCDYNVRLSFQARADHILTCYEKFPEFFYQLDAISNYYNDNNKESHISTYGRQIRGIGIDIGIEAFSDSTLKYFRKGLNSKTNINCLQIMSKYNIDIGVYMILFTPVVTIENIITELEHYYKYYLKNNYSSKLVFSNLFKPLVAYKGTDIYNFLKESGDLINERYYKFKDLRVAAFYIVIQNELVSFCSNNKFTMIDMYNAVLNLAYKCKELNIEKNSILNNVICEYYDSNIIAEVYSKYICNDIS